MNDSSQDGCCDEPYASLAAFSSAYHKVHVFLSLILCIFGICLNALNVVVLCQKRMLNSNNLLLTCLAISDGMVMLIYIIYDLGFRLVPRLESGMSKEYAHLLLACIVGQNLFHTFSTWIIVVIAAYRLLYIHTGPRAKAICAPLRIWLTIAMVTFLSIVLTMPFVFAHEVTHYRKQNSSDIVLYEVDYVDNVTLQTILFFNSALLVKALPILLLSILSATLIRKIHEIQLNRRRLLPLKAIRQSVTVSLLSTVNASGVQRIRKLNWFFLRSCGGYDSIRQSIQPTKVLLAVALMYILTYLPQTFASGFISTSIYDWSVTKYKWWCRGLLYVFQSAMLILNRYMGRCFQMRVYERLGDLLDLLTLSNNGITFFIYCVMSAQFRDTLTTLLTVGRRKPHNI